MINHLDFSLFLNQLLTDLARRLHGAIDCWTIVCIEPMGLDVRAFITEHSQVLKALVIVIDAELAPIQASPTAYQAIERIREDCDALESDFLFLADHRQHHSGEIRLAVEELKQLWTELVQTIAELGRMLGCPIAFLEQMEADRKAYYQRMLDSLPDLFQNTPAGSAAPNSVVAS